MKIKILKYSLAALTFLFAFLAWRSVDQAINVADSSVWAVPIILFSILAVLFYLDIIIIKRTAVLQLIFLAVFLLTFVFVHSFWHLVAVALSYLFAIWAILKIKKDLRLNVKIDLWKSIRTGSTLVILAVSLVITSQYYFEIKNSSSEHLVPQIKFGNLTGNFTSKILSMVNPEFRDVDSDGMTVDQFILKIAQNQNNENGMSDGINAQVDQIVNKTNSNLTPAQKQLIKAQTLQKVNDASSEISQSQNELMLADGRSKFSEIAGENLTGNEKVSDVLSQAVNGKINQYLGSGLPDSDKSSPLPYILAIGLFLTVLPLGSFLNTLWILLVELAFLILKKLELVHINKIPIEMEIIE